MQLRNNDIARLHEKNIYLFYGISFIFCVHLIFQIQGIEKLSIKQKIMLKSIENQAERLKAKSLTYQASARGKLKYNTRFNMQYEHMISLLPLFNDLETSDKNVFNRSMTVLVDMMYGKREVELKFDDYLIKMCSGHEEMRKYVKEKMSLEWTVINMSQRDCAMCLDKYKLRIKMKNNEEGYCFYSNYLVFNKCGSWTKVNGENETNRGYEWTPTKKGKQSFKIEYLEGFGLGLEVKEFHYNINVI